MNKKKLLLGLLAGLLICPPQLVAVPRIWDEHHKPASFSRQFSVAGAWALVCGMLAGGIAEATLPDTAKPFGRTLAVLGSLAACATAFQSYKNTLQSWCDDFELAFEALSRLPLLVEGDSWMNGYELPIDAERLQEALQDVLQQISRLREIAFILIQAKSLSVKHSRDVALKMENLSSWEGLSRHRWTQISLIVDLKTFHRSYERIVSSRSLKTGSDQNAWMMRGGALRSYTRLDASLNRAGDRLRIAKNTAHRLLGDTYSAILAPNDRHDISQKLEELKKVGLVHKARSKFVSARVKFEQFADLYDSLRRAPELKVDRITLDEWIFGYFGSTPTGVALSDAETVLESVYTELLRAYALGDELLKAPAVEYFSADEQSFISSRVRSIHDFVVICQQRQSALRGMRKLASFHERYEQVMQPRAVWLRASGANDLSWMEMPRNTRWPLQELHKFLEASKADVSALLLSGNELAANDDVRVVPERAANNFDTKLQSLESVLALIDMRMLFLCNSTMYAQEVRAKLDYKEQQREIARQQEELRKREEDARVRERQERKRLARQQQEEQAREAAERERLALQEQELQRQQNAARREEDRLARERDRLERERVRQARLPQPSAPPVDVAVSSLPAPSAPSAEEGWIPQEGGYSVPQVATCFCGKKVTANKMYKLDHKCRINGRYTPDGFYHEDCIKRHLQYSSDCPQCFKRGIKLSNAHKAVKEKLKKLEPLAEQKTPQVADCFCGDGIPVDKMYKLSCGCKSSFYHQDCIKKWVKDSKTCPTCRAKVALADIQKVGSYKLVASEAPKLLSVQPVPSVPPAVPASQQPAAVVSPAEAEECYLCMDSMGDCTTANCDCTVKKAACRACLQDWLNRNHTCPNCRKQGATVVSLSR